jgi:hypothetical protein
MIAVLTAVLGSKFGKYFVELGVVGGLVFGAYWYAVNHGKAVQKDEDNKVQAQELEKARQVGADAKDLLVKQAHDHELEADQRAQEDRAKNAALVSVLQGLGVKEKEGKTQVSQLPDSELRSDIIHKLSVRAANDMTACYLPSEERVLDNAITQYPLCVQGKAVLTEQVTTKEHEVQDQVVMASSKQATIDALQVYITQLEKDYKVLYDQHPPKKRSIKCLFIWKCAIIPTNIVVAK